MKTGTKSLLFGVHQFVWHPITVLIAWIYLYKSLPNWKELVCIVIHDWGYWGCENMDDRKGEGHPLWAAGFAMKWFGPEYYCLCLYHSRHYARRHSRRPSKLCWPDKLSIAFEPWWFYLPRALASRELFEYRLNGNDIPTELSHRQWFKIVKQKIVKVGMTQKADAVKYSNPERA